MSVEPPCVNMPVAASAGDDCRWGGQCPDGWPVASESWLPKAIGEKAQVVDSGVGVSSVRDKNKYRIAFNALFTTIG